MSNNNFGFYYPPNASNYPVNSQNWSNWSFQSHTFDGNYSRPPPPPPQFTTPPPVPEKMDLDTSAAPPRINAVSPRINPVAPRVNSVSPRVTSVSPRVNSVSPRINPPPTQYYGNNNGQLNRMYPRRFPNTSVPPPPTPPRAPGPSPYPYSRPGGYMRPNWQQQHNSRKRPLPRSCGDGDEVKAKLTKKKKKSLSQNIPSKKDWSLEDAEKALTVEKEFNKRFKHHSLIIKFPDLELNREIVSNFHPAIETVHFQQPSTPRFCFVTLKESEDSEKVIKALNETRFGQGCLMVEYKKDREDDQNIGPEDVDPLTLYVGNLGQEVTKEDMVRAFPKGRRIDIGYAKKMKFTRYAFVSFKCVEDSIEAFKQTHNTQMFNKSLIVRFRRLHGTVGMPGEVKTNNPKGAKGKEGAEGAGSPDKQTNGTESASLVSPKSPGSAITAGVSQVTLEDDYFAHMPEEKEEKEEIEDNEEVDRKPVINPMYSRFLEQSFDQAFSNHHPFKLEIKEEKHDDDDAMNGTDFPVRIKDEPRDDDDDEQSSDDDQGSMFPDIDYGSVLDNVANHTSKLNALRKVIT